MSRIKGTVSKVDKSQYSFYILLDENMFYYNTKFEPKCKVGDVVGIEFDKKADNRGQIKKTTILEVGDGPANDFEKPRPSGGGRPAAGADRQDSIVWQHSQEMALRAITVLNGAGGIAVKGTTDKKRVQIEGYIDELTARFFNDAMDPRKSTAFLTSAEIDADLGDGDPADFDGSDADAESASDAWDKWDN